MSTLKERLEAHALACREAMARGDDRPAPSAELLTDLRSARANLAGANLAGANLADAYLADAYLARANLADAYLADAYLARANIAGAYLARANLAGANLAGANLAGANLADAYLARANLARANLAGANLAGANLAGANLADANRPALEGTRVSWTDHSLLSEILWRDADTEPRQMLAAFVGRKRDWCWDQWETWQHPERDWALGVLVRWIHKDDTERTVPAVVWAKRPPAVTP